MDYIKIEERPKFFALVGWSWFVFSALGILSGLIGVVTLPGLKNLSMPGLEAQLQIIQSMMPAITAITWAQLILSILMNIASWKFLKRVNWGRLALSFFNALTGVGCMGMVVFMWGSFQANMATLAAEGIDPQMLSVASKIFVGIFGLCALLMIVPLIWMGWYFHSKPVREFFYNSVTSS